MKLFDALKILVPVSKGGCVLGGVGSPTPSSNSLHLGVLKFNSILTQLAADHTVKGLVLQDGSPPPTLNAIASRCHHPCFRPTGYRLKVPTTSFLGSVNLLEQFM